MVIAYQLILFLSWYAKKHNVSSKFIEHSGIINKKIQDWIFNKIKNIRKKVKKINLMFYLLELLIKNINDDRESPAIELMKSCIKDKINVSYNDPYIKSIKLQNKIFKSTSLNRKMKNIDLAILTTDHDIYNFKTIYKKFNKIIDTRKVL